MVSLICPSCGAPVMMPFGKRMCICEYCGSPVKEELSEAEIVSVEKNKEFVDAIKAAIHCISTRDYETAREYADKAAELLHDDPAPLMIKYVSWLEADYRKATSFLAIANSKRSAGESVAISNDEYNALLSMYVMNYLTEKEADLKRMFASMRKVKPADIQNVRQYEHLKRIGLYVSDPELKDALMKTSEEFLSECESKLPSSYQLGPSEWSSLVDIRDNYLFKLSAVLFISGTYSQRCNQFLTKYSNAVNQKWESAFKSGAVSGDKDAIRNYRAEADSLIAWAKTVR